MLPPLTGRRALTAVGAALGLLAHPAIAGAATTSDAIAGSLSPGAAVDTFFVIFAAVLVLLMQPGFLLLEVGFSRGKNSGTVVAKILINFSVAVLAFWAVGFAFAFGPDAGGLIGNHGFFLADTGPVAAAAAENSFPVLAVSQATIEAKFLFQFAFAAVALAIVWGPTLERIKFGVYVAFGIVFASVIYPIAAHWIFGGGFLQVGDWLGTGIVGMQDFAGSAVVGVVPAIAGLAAILVLGPRAGKYAPDGSPRAIPGHNMPLFGLGVTLLMIGWVGFNGGTALGAGDGRAGQIIVITLISGGAGTIAAVLVAHWKTHTIDIGMAGNGMIAGLVAITAPAGYIHTWPAPIIGAVAGAIVPLAVYAIDRHIDDPVGALSAHGICGIWGTISCGIFSAPVFAQYNKIGDPGGGLWYDPSGSQLIAQVAGLIVLSTFVFVASYATFRLIHAVYGVRVSYDHEVAGLDISEHGMYGYPEQFIPEAELAPWGLSPSPMRHASAESTPQESQS
ncbi:MAG: ammonium transporter [Solirubrobacteraceae bacterium]|nr:ammonium transporter [Solirubrobacteraceae bacterium]